ncbi:MAG: carboxypeptidase regulatory-like domain-containing protein [Anaerolineae bacterium]|nr:carboxypeptidase regulatory-like domain-containing protein [Anaerolineae bacterium]
MADRMRIHSAGELMRGCCAVWTLYGRLGRPRGSITRVLLLIVLIGVLQASAGCTAYHMVDFQVRRWRIRRWGYSAIPPGERGGFAGRVVDASGHPIAGAVVLVSEADGRTYMGRTGEDGGYEIIGVPARGYVPVAAAWGYQMRTGPIVRVPPRVMMEGVDFVLPPRPTIHLSADVPVTITRRSIVTGTFPTPGVRAERVDFRFSHEGVEITDDRLYLPVGRQAPGPVLVMVFPSDEPHWEPAAVAFASQGFTVLYTVPAIERGLDVSAHARDLLQAVVLLQSDRLSPGTGSHCLTALAGSFSTLYFYQALPDMPDMRAVIVMGGISDAFLGLRSLYEEDLAVPLRFQGAIAAMGRPDWRPDRFLRYSPAFFARHMPPTLIVHMVADRVIPVSQALRLDSALDEAGVRHELILYHDVSHYLNTWDPPPEVRAAFWRMVSFLQNAEADCGH